MLETTHIFKAIVVRVASKVDEAGLPYYNIYANILANESPIGDEFEVKQLSSIPTIPVGTRGVALPSEGQRILVFRDDQSLVNYIIGYIEDLNVQIPLYERPLEFGEYKIISQGIRPTEFSIKPNEILLDAGGYSNIKVSQREEMVEINSKRILTKFLGGYEEKGFNDSTKETSSVAVYSKKKEATIVSDRVGVETETPKSPTLAVSDYVDKVVIRAGTILDYDNINNKLGHVYQLETRQDVGSTQVKNTFTNLKIGYQTSSFTNYPKQKGTLIDWSTKHTNPDGTLTTSVWRKGLLDNNEFYRFQVGNNIIESGSFSYDPNRVGKGYKAYDLSIDNTSKMDFLYGESIAVSGDYFYRRSINSKNSLLFTEEVSKEYYINNKVESLGSNKNIFTETLKDDEYKLKLEAGNTEYLIKISNNKIIIVMDPNDPTKKASIKLSGGKIEINPGNTPVPDMVNINSNGISHNLVTKEWVLNMFANHMHPTAGVGPPSPPIPMPAVENPSALSPFTYITKAQ